MPIQHETYFNAVLPDGTKKAFMAEDFDAAAEAFEEIAEDMVVDAQKQSKETGQPVENWATKLLGKPTEYKLKRVQDGLVESRTLTLAARTEDMPREVFPEGPQSTRLPHVP